MNLTSAQGNEEKIVLTPYVYMLDGPGMVYEGGPLDEALTGFWHSEDDRFTLEANGKCAAFSADGRELTSLDHGYFFDHSFAEGDDLNERNELIPFGGPDITDENYETILTIDEMWYQAEHIYMNITWPDGNTEKIVFSRQEESPTGREGEEAWENEP